MRLTLMFAESAFLPLEVGGCTLLRLGLGPLSCIVRSSFSNRSSNSPVKANADSANINSRRTVVRPPLGCCCTTQ